MNCNQMLPMPSSKLLLCTDFVVLFIIINPFLNLIVPIASISEILQKYLINKVSIKTRESHSLSKTNLFPNCSKIQFVLNLQFVRESAFSLSQQLMKTENLYQRSCEWFLHDVTGIIAQQFLLRMN